MGSASGIHEGKEEEAPQVPVEQVGPAEGLAEQVGPAHERVNGERPTWGNAAPTPGSEDDDDDYLDWQGYGEFQREAYNRLVGYDKVKRGITKRSEQLTALRKDHFNILEREHARVDEARNALKKVVDEQFREGRHLMQGRIFHPSSYSAEAEGHHFQAVLPRKDGARSRTRRGQLAVSP